MMAYTQENIVSSTQENAENNLSSSRENCDTLGAVQFCSFNYAKVASLPSTQTPKYNLKDKLDQKKVQKKKSKNGKKKKKKKQKQNLLEKIFLNDETFKETVNCLKMLNQRCGELVLMCKDSMTIDRLNGFMSIVIEFLKKSDKECLTKPSKACIIKPLLNDIVYLIHLIYSDLKKFKFDSKDRPNYLNKMSDLLAMVIDVEITTSKIFACKKCKGKAFKTEAKLKEHLKKIHKMKTSTEGCWKDDNDSNSNIGILEEEREKLISVLLSTLYIYLDNSSNHVLDTMLKTTNKNKKKASKICSIIFSRILQSPQQPMSILDYARYILAFKMWKKMLDSMTSQREVTRLAVSRLPQPPLYFRERVAILEGIMPPVPTTKPDSSVTEYCLSVKSVRSVKYELKDQIQKYLMLISNPQKFSELLKKLSFFSENLIDFDVKDSVFAVDDEDMILYDTFPPDSPTKNSASNKNKDSDKKSTDKKRSDKKSADKKSADKKIADKKSTDKKTLDKKAKSSATVDCQTDSKMIADHSDKTELVTSSNEEREQDQEITIKSETDIIEVSDAQSNSLDNVCAVETLNCEESTKVNEVAHTSNDIINENITGSLCDDTNQKRPDILSVERDNSPRKPAEDKYLELDNAVNQAKLFENLKKVFERPPVKPTAPEVMKTDRISSPEKKNQMITPCVASSSGFSASVSDLMCEPWPFEFVGDMEKFMERNRVGANVIEGDEKLGLKANFKEEVYAVGENCVIKGEGTRETSTNCMTSKEEEEERRRICNLEDDFITELFSEQPGQSDSYLVDFFNTPIDDLSLINNVEAWSNDGTSQPLLSYLMDDLAFTDVSDIAAITEGNNEESFINKDNTQSPSKAMSLESVLALPPNEPNSIEEASVEQKSYAEKRALASSNDDHDEPPMKKSKSSTSADAHNYLLTPPSTPVASESAKTQVESQKDALSTSKATSSEKSSENLVKSSSVTEPPILEIVDKMSGDNKDHVSPAKQFKSSSENRPSSPSKIVKHSFVDRQKDSAKNNPIKKPTISTPECTCDQRLSGSLIDSYFTYFHRVLSKTDEKRAYIFSVSFYPLLTSESSKVMKLRNGLAEKRHSQVENITRNVNIFEKDFIIFPIEKHGHWLVVIVCFPGLSGPVEYQQKEQIRKHISPKKNLVQNETVTGTAIGKVRRTRLGCYSVNEKRNSKETADSDTGLNNKSIGSNKLPTKATESNLGQEDRTSRESQPIKQPCILVFDSSPKPRKTEVVEVIRDYLRVEYKVKYGKDKDFSTFMKDSRPKVPTRKNSDKNSACCGVYMLQYADSFFNNPIVDFRLPIKHTQNWFPADAISRKRDDIFRFLPWSSCEPKSAHNASQMLHVKSCQKGKTTDQRRSSEEKYEPVTVTKDSQRSTTTVFDKPIAVLEDCNTSDDIFFRGFTDSDLDHQPLDGLLSPDHRTTTLTADLIIQSDDDNAMMNVINEEEVVTSKCSMSDSSNICTPELFVALSRSDYVSPLTQEKKKRILTRTTTALSQKTLPITKRKNVWSENSASSEKLTTITSKKSESANKAANKCKKPEKRTRKSVRRCKVVSPLPKSVKSLRSSNESSRGKDDNSTSIPLRTHHFNELWKTIQKMDKKKGRRCRK